METVSQFGIERLEADVILDFLKRNDFARAEDGTDDRCVNSTLSIIAKVVETYQPGVIVLRCWAGSHAGDGVKINQGMYVKDDKSELSILVNRSIGGSTIVDGQLVLMLHMRFLYYDGVAEALNGTLCVGDDCRGLAVPWSKERPLENKELNLIIEKLACDVSLKSKLSTINDENVLLKTQVEYVLNERENIKLEYQKLFNSIKATRTQHQKELNELIEHVNQKTYAYVDVRAQNQDLLMTISELKDKLKIVDRGKNVYTKFDKSKTLGTLLCVTPLLPKNIAVKAKKVSTSKVNTDRSKLVTSHSPPNNEQSRTQNENVLARGMYRITKTETLDSKTNTTVSNSTGVESSNSIRRTRNSSVKRALFTTPIAAKSKNLDTTSVVAKSRLSVAKTATITTKVSSVLSLSPDSSQSRTLSNYMKNKIATSRKWQKWFEYKQGFNWSPKSKIIHSQSIVPKSITSVKTKSKTPATTQKWRMLEAYDWQSSIAKKFCLEIHRNNEAPDMIIEFVNQVQRNLKAQILTIRTDKGTEFKNEKLRTFYAKLGIVHKTSIARTPQQNGVVERRNHTLVEAARTMLIFSKSLEFLWAEAIATASFTQNRSIIHTRGFRIYNRQTKKIMETIHVKFDELTTMGFECNNLELGTNTVNFQDSSEVSQFVPSKTDLDNLFGPLYEESYPTSSPEVSDNSAANTLDNENTSSSSSIFIEEDKAP
ncbi:retrovirus-related pol polyprotein from transposon TNT 1-94 [Tanacetum coccineum]